jgi:IS30 family transposase
MSQMGPSVPRLCQIADRPGRAPSTVCREVARNAGRRRYRALGADRAALLWASRPKAAQLAVSTKLKPSG